MKTVIKGVPGGGKTTSLLNLIANNFDPRETMFVSFTRDAIIEARKRAMEKWGIEKSEIKYFRTLHSICFRLMGLTREDIFSESDIESFFKSFGIKYVKKSILKSIEEGEEFVADSYEEESDGNRLLGIINYIKHVYKISPLDIKSDELKSMLASFIYKNDIKFKNSLLNNINHLADIVIEYEKRKEEKVDYTDTLLKFLKNPVIDENIKYLVVDEFQDLSPLMYEIIKFFESKTKEQVYAGDEQQCIFTFLGASKKFLIKEFNEANVRTVLEETKRMRKFIAEFAERYAIKNMKNKIGAIKSNLDGGEVHKVFNINLVHFENLDVFFLHRSNRQKKEWKKKLIEEGIRFKELGFGKRIWTESLDKIYSAILKIKNGEKVKDDELKELIEVIPTDPFLIRGVKTKLRKGEFIDFFGNRLKEFSVDFINKNFFQYQNINYIVENLKALKIDKDRLEALRIKLLRNPKPIGNECLKIGTIHSVKGMEANIVILNCEVPKKIMKRWKEVWEDEASVYYVGITRAKEKLFLLEWLKNPLFNGL